MAAIWDFRQSWVYSLLNEMLKLKETIVLNTRNWTYLQCFNSVAPCLARTEHIYSVLMVLAPC